MRLSHYTHTSASNCWLLWALYSPINITQERITGYPTDLQVKNPNTDNNITKLLRNSTCKSKNE